MKKITKKNKIKIEGYWTNIGIDLYWHPKSDYIFSNVFESDKETLIPLSPFGRGEMELKIKIKKNGNAEIINISSFDLAVLKIKLDRYGFTSYKFLKNNKKTCINFKSNYEKAMFQVYFSEFII